MSDPIITDKAVEAARDELAGWQIGSGYYANQVAVDEALDMAHAALEAALPLIVREAKAEALEEAAEALEEAADEYAPGRLTGIFLGCDKYLKAWLRDRAERTRGGAE